MDSSNGYHPGEPVKPEIKAETVISGKSQLTETANIINGDSNQTKVETIEDTVMTETKKQLDKRDLKKIFGKLLELNEKEYVDEIGKTEAQFYAQSKLNSQEFIPDITKLSNEAKEEEIPPVLDEFGENEQDIVRTLEDFTVYDKFGNLIKLIDILEKPYYDFVDDIVCYGTVVKPLPDELRVKPAALPKDSNRTIVRSMLERSIPRGFRQSEFCTASPKNFKPKKKTASKKSRTPKPTSNLTFNSPHYVPGVSREDAHAKARELLQSVSMPLKVGTIRVVQLGRITDEKGYHNQKHLYPIGFTSERLYTSVLDPGIKVKYTSEILEGEKGPLFRVTHEGGTPQYEAATSSAVWLKILKALNLRKEQMGIPPKGTAISGPEMMGFAHKKIAAVIEGLDGVLGCTQYLFRAQRIESGAPKRKRSEMIKPSPLPSPLSVETGTTMEMETEEDQSPAKQSQQQSTEEVKERSGSVATVFEENDSFANKRQKVVHLTEQALKTFSPTELEEVKRLSKMLSLLTTNEEKQIYQTLLKLKVAPVSLNLLYNTGLGKVVNRLRKHASSEVASLAKFLKKKWVNVEDSEIELTSEDKSRIRKACSKIVSYIGFGDEQPPKGFKSHESKNAPRKKLLESLNSLDRDFANIPVDVLVDTNIGKRVNKLRKHLDEDIQMVALKLKGKWKKQIAEEEVKQKELLEQVASGKVPASSIIVEKPQSKSALRVEQFTFDESIDIVAPTVGDLADYQMKVVEQVREERKSNRVRVKLSSVTGVRITHSRKLRDATLWIVTKKARYRVAGERCASFPSYRYYYHFKDAFFAFLSAVYTLRALREDNSLSIATIPEGLSQAAEKRAKTRLMLITASKIIKQSTRCPCPSYKLLQVNKTEKYRRLNFDILSHSYETVIDEVTRTEDSDIEAQAFLKTWFIDLLISRGNCYHAKRKKDSLRIEKDFFRKKGSSDEQPNIFGSSGSGNSQKSKKLAGKKMVKEGINLPDDMAVVFDDQLPESSRQYSFLPKTIQPLCQLVPATPVSSIPEFAFVDKKALLIEHKFTKQPPNMSSGCFGALLNVWCALNLISEEVDVLSSDCQSSFLAFRSRFFRSDLGDVHKKLLLAILEADRSLKSNQSDNDSRYVQGDASAKISTRASAVVDDGYVKPQTEISDEVSSYVYNVDELYPYPAFTVTETSWPSILKRLLQQELLKESEKESFLHSGLLPSFFSIQLSTLIPKPDLLATCIEILNKIMDSPLAPPFSNPVNTAEYPNYLTIIDRPMDLNTIKLRIESGHYESSNLPSEEAYSEELSLPKVEIEPKPTETDEASEEEEDNVDDDEDDDKEDIENTVGENGRVMEYFIRRKQRKAGKWRTKTEFQLQSELRHKKREVAALTSDQKYYKYDCAGAGHRGVLADVRQVWRNCRKFNRSSTRIYSDCQKLESTFMKLYEKQVVKRDPTLNQKHEEAVKTDLETKKALQDSKVSQYSYISQTLPLPSEVYAEMEETDYTLLSAEHKVVLLEWLVNQVLDLSKIRTLFVSKLDALQQVEREEVITSKLHDRTETDKQKPELEGNEAEQEADHRKEMYLQNLYEHSLKLEVIGEDRHFNRYFGVYPIVKKSGWILREAWDTGEWSVIHDFPQLDSLISQLDDRGCRENKLLRRLNEYWLPLWKRSVITRKEKVKEVSSNLKALIGSSSSSNTKAIQKKLEEDLYQSELQLQDVFVEGRKWLTATADGGKIYYYHEETRETTWNKPESRAKMEALQEKISQLKGELEEMAKSPEAKQDALVAAVTSDGEMLEFIETSGIQDTLKNSIEDSSFVFKQHVLSLVARLQTLEMLTLGPSCVTCYSQQHTQWCEKLRVDWLASLEKAIGYTVGSLKPNRRARITRETVVVKKETETVERIVQELVSEVECFDSRYRRNRLLKHDVPSLGLDSSFIVYSKQNYEALLEKLKEAMLVLYQEFEGSPYSVEALKAQEGIVRAMRHSSRWQRALNAAKNLAEVSLLEAQLRHLIDLKEDSQYERQLAKETSNLLKQWVKAEGDLTQRPASFTATSCQ